jgi:4-hydroxybenzoate polyprenyltransferase
MFLLSIISKLSDPIRAGHWWKYKAAHILGFAYFYFYLIKLPLKESIIILLLSAVTIIGVAGLGYVINDLYDIEPDRLAGKRNRMERFSWPVRVLIMLTLVAVALLPWLYLKSNPWIWIFMGFEIFLFGIYAHPLTRLKERSLWGPICDALYGHAVPVVIACLTYQQYFEEVPYPVWPFFIVLLIWQFLKGMRNIFLHQMEDHNADIASGMKTYTVKCGSKFVYRLITRLILPLEWFSGSLLAYLLYLQAPFIGIGFGLFLLFYLLGHGLFRTTQTGAKNFHLNTYLYFLNDWYEDYFPWVFLLAMISVNWHYSALAAVHLLMFPETLGRIFKDFILAFKEASLILLYKVLRPIKQKIAG